MPDNDLSQMCAELEDAASLCSDELGDWWFALAKLYSHVEWVGSEEFAAAYEAQVRLEHARLNAEYEIVEERTTRRVLRERKQGSGGTP